MKLKITIDNKTYEVDVEAAESEPAAPQPQRLSVESAPVRVAGTPPPAPPAESKPVNEEKVCRSPVTGIVERIAAQIGQTLQAGDVLIVLEAMKMETSVTAPVAGKVAAVNVKPGDSVQSGQVLVEFA